MRLPLVLLLLTLKSNLEMAMINFAISSLFRLELNADHFTQVLVPVQIIANLGVDTIHPHFKMREFKVEFHVKM